MIDHAGPNAPKRDYKSRPVTPDERAEMERYSKAFYQRQLERERNDPYRNDPMNRRARLIVFILCVVEGIIGLVARWLRH